MHIQTNSTSRRHAKNRASSNRDRTYYGKTYCEWIDSLKVGDPVRVRLPWVDREVPGGVMVKGRVDMVSDGDHWRVRVKYRYKGHTEHTVFNAHGGASFRVLEHPNVDSIYNPDGRMDQANEFPTAKERRAFARAKKLKH